MPTLHDLPPLRSNSDIHSGIRHTSNPQLLSLTQTSKRFGLQAVVVSILPVVPAYIVCWPWALVLVLRGRWVVGVLLAVTQHAILSAIDTELCTQVFSIAERLEWGVFVRWSDHS